ncbi:hypothetical protein HZU77_004065 [Neisseriaceae bacterium TC5R-5]|nr:hypothetical protein [Neisseriaceae bacterium TC5R-5]
MNSTAMSTSLAVMLASIQINAAQLDESLNSSANRMPAQTDQRPVRSNLSIIADHYTASAHQDLGGMLADVSQGAPTQTVPVVQQGGAALDQGFC